MAYATVADLISRYGQDEILQRTDRTGAGTVDATIAQKALDDASAEMDSYLASRYQLPLPTVPPYLTRLCCVIARYLLWEDLASERVRQDYEDARRFLEGIAKGVVSLGLPAALPPDQTPKTSLAAAKAGPAPMFDRTSLEGY